MKANELRIGNYVKDMDYDYVTIAGIHPQSTNELTICINDCDVGDRLFKDVEGIPLTEEWLLKFGFKVDNRFAVKQYRIDGDKYHSLNMVSHKINYWSPIIRCDSQKQVFELYGINYIHQLQNLYFALTGTELKLNEKS